MSGESRQAFQEYPDMDSRRFGGILTRGDAGDKCPGVPGRFRGIQRGSKHLKEFHGISGDLIKLQGSLREIYGVCVGLRIS